MKELKKRVFSALILAPTALYCIYLGKVVFFLFLLLACIFMIHEMGKILEKKEMKANVFFAYIASPFLLYSLQLMNSNLTLLVIGIYVLLLLLYELFWGKGSAIHNVAGSIFLLFYPILFIGSLLALREFYPYLFKSSYQDGAYFIFMIFLSIWSCDTFAYFGGSRFGKHKLYPKISPNKSVEGAAFGFVFAILVAVLFQQYILTSLVLWKAFVLGAIVGIFGQIGDLIESQFKRDAAIKDSGKTIPGHGGILDRLDSVLYVAPIIFILLYASSI